ncbi:RHS repeat-associated core domain-containing protein [Burkholderia sp. ABCPW 111]|uniref:RHS repeat-associated core domain-containing protein n=1 Tax=Burkholderia sp. ABCPW 111 TaxID=1820025 RepID=UPI0005320929|nr:RHS repeat-associated core domain-containing protein [Burkholderia sp. ABCPW 111]KGR93886.1 RHS repeat-associated core domain protein [Burkholderia sp. ABCPW 111]
MSLLAAARAQDTFTHTSLLAQMLKVAATIGAGLLVGAAIGAAAAFVVGTGGLGAVVLGAVVGAVMSQVVNAAASHFLGSDSLEGYLSDKAGELIDSFIPGDVKGAISTGSTDVFVNGRGAARAAGMPAPPLPPGVEPQSVADLFVPVDQDFVACSNHPNPAGEHLAEGSSSVFVNGRPASRIKDATTCDGKINTGSTNVSIGGDRVRVRDVTSEMPPWLATIAKYAGLAIALCQAIRGKGPLASKLACFAMNFAINVAADKLVGSVMSGRIGHPVHLPTGAKILDGEEDLDFVLSAPVPIVWQRFYSSLDPRDDRPLGRGWNLPYAVELRLGAGGENPHRWIDAQGRGTPVPDLQPGQKYFNRSEGLTFACTPGGHWMVEQDDGMCFDFGLPRSGLATQTLRPVVFEDRNANQLHFHYDAHGRLDELATMAGHRVRIEYDASRRERMSRVILHAGGASECLVSYTYTSDGLLASVSDAQGRERRRFGYDPAGRMTMHRLPGGKTARYAWEEFERKALAEENGLADREARIVEHWTDDGERYRITYDFERQAARVTDQLGRTQLCEWNADYLVTAHTDALGRNWRFDWSPNRELLGFVEPNGATTRLRYDDERGLPTELTNALGEKTQFAWHPLWMALEQQTLADGRQWKYEFDMRGNRVGETDPLGQRIEFRLNRQGRPAAIVDERGGITHFGWDGQHRLIARTDCSGITTRFEHDARGRMAALTDALGNTTRYRHDGRDRIVETRLPTGGDEQYRWSLTDELAAFVDGNGHATAFAYDAAGRLASRTDANGHRVSFEYDAAGNLRTLRNEVRDSYRFAYDAGDRLIEQIGPDGLRVEYERDARGAPIVVRQAAGTPEQITIELERDALGRLVRRRTPETVTTYDYDATGRLERIARKHLDGRPMNTVTFAYDELDRLVAETSDVAGDDGQVATTRLAHEYDALGNRTGTTLPDGRTLSWLYYGSGHLHRIASNGETVCDFERDRLHREVSRTQGAQTLATAYDGLSRKIGQWIGDWQRTPGSWAAFGTRQSRDLLRKAFAYDRGGELTARIDPLGGELNYHYDPAGRLLGGTAAGAGAGAGGRPDAAGVLTEAFAYDAASNLRPVGQPGRVEGNRLLMSGDRRYRYDAHGRLVEKLTGGHTEQHLKYDVEHRLVEVRTVRRGVEQTVRFSYDALGRRIAKHDAFGTTRFVWDGMRLAQEYRGHQAVTYLYEGDGYVPLARIDAVSDDSHWLWRLYHGGERDKPEAEAKPEAKIYYFHANAGGAPEELTDRGGRVVWRTRYRAWGNTVLQAYAPEFQANPSGDVMQPLPQALRFQGQYEDLETGFCYSTFRYYDPDVGRFITPDPIGLAGGLNQYQYAPNPIGWIDPWGLSCVSDLKNIKEQLNSGKRAQITVNSRAEAEELLIALTTGKGMPRAYRNTTGQALPKGKISESGSDWLPGGRGAYEREGTYHWDAADANAKPGDHALQGDHLQIHNFDGKIIRIFY